MQFIFGANWHDMFVPNTPVLEIFLRGTIMYLALFTLLRLVLKREAGSLGIADLLVIVLLADVSQNAMSGNYVSIPDGLILVCTIVFWSYALDWLGYKLPLMERFVHPPARPLVRDGQPIWRNLKRELITPDELMTALRLQGVDDLAKVSAAYLEGDGRISVITVDNSQHSEPERPAT